MDYTNAQVALMEAVKAESRWRNGSSREATRDIIEVAKKFHETLFELDKVDAK